jgi:tetratricopeptide (TPR) repeat protein
MALENFDIALSINPNFPEAYINRALFFRREKRLKDAQKDYEKALSLKPDSFNITTFSEVDIFKYGKVSSVMDVNYVEKGTLFMDVNFSSNKNAEADSNILINAKNLPYFIFRKKRREPIMNKQFVKFEFALAKCIFYIHTCILRRQIKYVDNAVLYPDTRKKNECFNDV